MSAPISPSSPLLSGSRPKVVVVTGPTASGKTGFGIALAKALRGEVVSADSMQVYRRLDIGTAKPTPAERSEVPHHLIDVVDLDETYHVGRYRAEAEGAIAGILARGGVPVVVGGTALYLKVLLHGLTQGPARDDETRQDLESRWDRGEGPLLWDELCRGDPALSARLHRNDRSRILRGLEVLRTTGERLSALQSRHGFAETAYDALLLGMELGREELCCRIDQRVPRMLEDGWVEEVRRVLSQGYPSSLPPLQAIGYRQICRHLLEGIGLPETVREIQTETRRFAKRQMTWFRRMEIRWLRPEAADEGIDAAKKFLQTPLPPI